MRSVANSMLKVSDLEAIISSHDSISMDSVYSQLIRCATLFLSSSVEWNGDMPNSLTHPVNTPEVSPVKIPPRGSLSVYLDSMLGFSEL